MVLVTSKVGSTLLSSLQRTENSIATPSASLSDAALRNLPLTLVDGAIRTSPLIEDRTSHGILQELGGRNVGDGTGCILRQW